MTTLQYPLTLSFERFSFGNKVHVLDADTAPVLFVRKKPLALKEVVDVSTGGEQPNPLYRIKADRILDYAATYTIYDADNVAVGSVQRKGMRSRWKALYETIQSYRKFGWNLDFFRPIWDVQYVIKDAEGQEVGFIAEDMPLMKLIGTVFSEIFLLRPFLNPEYHIMVSGESVLAVKKMPAFFTRTFTVTKEAEMSKTEAPLLLNSLMMALFIEKSLGI